MANVITKVALIRNAVYGEEVRESLATGIEAINVEVVSTTGKQADLETSFNGLIINAGNSNAEIVDARLGETTLKAKLQNVDSSLANKATHDEVFSLANMGQDVITAMTGGSVAVNGNNTASSTVIINKAVTPVKTSFFAMGKNTFNKLGILSSDYNINPTTGALVSSTGYTVSDFMPDTANTQHSVTNGVQCNIVSFDKDQNYISGVQITSTVYTSPVGTMYTKIGFVTSALHILQYEVGALPTTYEQYKTQMDLELYGKDNSISFQKLKYPMAHLLNNGLIKLDLTAKTLQILPYCHVIIDQIDYTLTEQTVDITTFLSANPTNIHIIYYNTTTNIISIVGSYNAVIPKSCIVLFYQYGNSIFSVNKDAINFIDANGKSNVTATFSETTQRLLLPPKMYFVDTMKMPLYKSSIISKTTGLDLFKTVLQNIESDNTPNYTIFEDIKLNGTLLNNTFKVSIQQNINSFDYFNSIVKSVVASTANTGKTKNYMAFGDSLTGALSTHYSVRDKMATFGVTTNLVGTLNSCEGRPGWRYKNFVGASNQDWGNLITISTSGATTTLDQNPFLKLANATDTTNHPDWCFRNTGAETELSYVTDADKTGNFYIFDYANYLSTHGITAPDIITINLSTNDIQHESETVAIINSRLAMKIMITQIKIALPNVIIGIIPTASWNATQGTWGNTLWDGVISSWIDKCIQDVVLLQATYNNLSIIPVWCHMSRYFSFPYNAPTLIGNESKATSSQLVHFDTPQGKAEYSNAVSAWFMNMI